MSLIKNKEILNLLEKKKKEISCDNCKYCNLNAFHRGQWYCRKQSIFPLPVKIEECFENKDLGGAP